MRLFFFNGTFTEGLFTGLYVKFLFIKIGKYTFDVPLIPLGYNREYGLFLREIQKAHIKALEELPVDKETLH
jgi:hypothetical protein